MKVKSKMLEKKKINRFEYRCLLFVHKLVSIFRL